MYADVARGIRILLLLLTVLAAALVRAGGGPQDVLIVANGRSGESLEIANAYRRARGIPYRNVLALNTTTDFAVSSQTYQQEIEGPIRAYLKDQQLEESITNIVLTRGVPLQVNVDGGRSVPSLLASMNMPVRPKRWSARMVNPYPNIPVAFSHRPDALRGMYLVTVLTGYNTRDALRLIAQGAADGMAPTGRYLLQTGPNLRQAGFAPAMGALTGHGLTGEIITAPPGATDDLMGYFSEGAFSGVDRETVARWHFRPGSIADLAQSFGAAEHNFNETVSPVRLPISLFVQAGVAGIHGVVAEGGTISMPSGGSLQQLLDRYASGFSLAESFYAALPSLGWQNLVIGDPLCAPYAQRPTVSIDPGTDPLTGMAPIRVSATSPVPGTTISQIDLYVDDHFTRTLYTPENTQVTLSINDEAVTYVLPPGATLRTLLLGLEEAVKNDRDLAAPDGVDATAVLNNGTLLLTARTPGRTGNNIPVAVTIDGERPGAPGVTVRAEADRLSGGGMEPTKARATLSFVGRRARAGDTITLQVLQERLTYTVPEGATSLTDVCDALVNLVEDAPALKGRNGVHAFRDPRGMPVVILEAREPGENGNRLPFAFTVKATDGSPLRGYPEVPWHLEGGSNGTEARLALHFVVGETTAQGTYLLNTADLPDGVHRIRAVAYDGSLAQVQGSRDVTITVRNQGAPPVVALPAAPLGPAVGELPVTVTASPQVARVEFFVDGQLRGQADGPNFTGTVSLAGLGRGVHDLWAEGIDAQQRRYVTAPQPVTVLVPPTVSRLSTEHGTVQGDVRVLITGAGFAPGCTVTCSGVRTKTVNVISPNTLEITTGPAAAGRGAVAVTNPDGTTATLADAFEYYVPRIADLDLAPEADVLAPGRRTRFTVTRCIDQFNEPYAPTFIWEAPGANITRDGLYTAPRRPGTYVVRVGEAGNDKHWEATVNVGPAPITDGKIRHWLVLGPIADPQGNALEAATLPNEATLRPSHGDQALEQRWQSLRARVDRDGYLDFLPAFTSGNTNAVAYACVYLNVKDDLACNLVFGSDDGMRLWLNGDLIHTARTRRSANPNDTTLPVTLQAGWNTLLVKVDQGMGDWGLYMRLVLPNGKAPEGITYALDKP